MSRAGSNADALGPQTSATPSAIMPGAITAFWSLSAHFMTGPRAHERKSVRQAYPPKILEHLAVHVLDLTGRRHHGDETGDRLDDEAKLSSLRPRILGLRLPSDHSAPFAPPIHGIDDLPPWTVARFRE